MLRLSAVLLASFVACSSDTPSHIVSVDVPTPSTVAPTSAPSASSVVASASAAPTASSVPTVVDGRRRLAALIDAADKALTEGSSQHELRRALPNVTDD